ncbi:MAG TPA: hypothetical protein DCW37_04660 [Cellvibrionales bacterium]|nr:hypothetical protein [Cellvibrionales bacterium]
MLSLLPRCVNIQNIYQSYTDNKEEFVDQIVVKSHLNGHSCSPIWCHKIVFQPLPSAFIDYY